VQHLDDVDMLERLMMHQEIQQGVADTKMKMMKMMKMMNMKMKILVDQYPLHSPAVHQEEVDIQGSIL
jgi:hypothetical protein